MGRARLTMEPISNERSRNTTFHKRKNGLKKKMYEFSTLCGVDACMIIYGPSRGGSPSEAETWPSDAGEVRRIIKRYQAKMEEQGKRSLDLSNFFIDRQRKVDDEIAKICRENFKAKYPVWDDRIDHMSLNQLMGLLGSIDKQLDHVRIFIEALKKRQFLIEGVTPAMAGCTNAQPSHSLSNHNSFPKTNMELEAMLPQSPPFVHPLNFQLPICYPSEPRPNPVVRTPMMKMKDEDYSLLGSMSSSNMQYTPMSGPCYYDPIPGMQDNLMYHIPWNSMNYYTPSIQVMQPYVQHPITPGAFQMHGPQVNNCPDFCDFEAKNKKAGL